MRNCNKSALKLGSLVFTVAHLYWFEQISLFFHLFRSFLFVFFFFCFFFMTKCRSITQTRGVVWVLFIFLIFFCFIYRFCLTTFNINVHNIISIFSLKWEKWQFNWKYELYVEFFIFGFTPYQPIWFCYEKFYRIALNVFCHKYNTQEIKWSKYFIKWVNLYLYP